MYRYKTIPNVLIQEVIDLPAPNQPRHEPDTDSSSDTENKTENETSVGTAPEVAGGAENRSTFSNRNYLYIIGDFKLYL